MTAARGCIFLSLFAISAINWIATGSFAADAVIAPTFGATVIQSMQLRAMGLSGVVEMAKQPGPGYFAVRIVVSATGTVPADKRLSFRFRSTDAQHPKSVGLNIDVPIVIRQGSKTTEVTRYLPKWSLGHCIEMTVYEDGRQLDDSKTLLGNPKGLVPLRIERNPINGTLDSNMVEAGLVRECRGDWLYVTETDELSLSEVPDLSVLRKNGVGRALLSSEQIPVGISAEPTPGYRAIGQADLPTDWRAYQTYDVVVMNSAAHNKIADNESALRSLRSWILQGGTIVVYGAKEHRNTIERWGLTPSEDSDHRQLLQQIARDRDAETKEIRKEVEGIIRAAKQGDEFDRLVNLTTALTWKAGIDPPSSMDQRSLIEYYQPILQQWKLPKPGQVERVIEEIRVSPVGFGLAITISSQAEAGDADVDIDQQSNRSDTVPSDLHWDLLRRFLDDRLSPMFRQGTEPIRGSDRFRNWTVPGVLQPPVYTFMGILSLFMVLVGPIAYRQTSKHGRSHLMFVIAPLLAITTTLAMLAYGVVADGFDTQVRVRQLTWVDGQSGDASERIRATYFAGIRPSEGLRFPATAIVDRQAEPTDLSWTELNRLPAATLGTITISDDAQVFDSRFLPSRDQRQFVTHFPRESVGRLQLRRDADQQATVVSTLGFRLRNLVLRDGNTGGYWSVDELPGSAATAASSIDSKTASKMLGEMYNQHRPVADADSRVSDNRSFQRSADVLGALAQRQSLSPALADGSFESWLSTRLQMSGELPKGHFVALADVSSDDLAVEDAELVESVRYVFGTIK